MTLTSLWAREMPALAVLCPSLLVIPMRNQLVELVELAGACRLQLALVLRAVTLRCPAALATLVLVAMSACAVAPLSGLPCRVAVCQSDRPMGARLV